jgi:VanZ family protein
MTLKLMAKLCSVAAIALLVILALGPAKWAPRTALGWQVDHFLGYLAITSMVCLAWPRPFVVGGALMALAALLEGLQAFTPDRSANVVAAMCGAGGALAAALIAELFTRARKRATSDEAAGHPESSLLLSSNAPEMETSRARPLPTSPRLAIRRGARTH